MANDIETPPKATTTEVELKCPGLADKLSTISCNACILLLLIFMFAITFALPCGNKCVFENQCSGHCRILKQLADVAGYMLCMVFIFGCFLCCRVSGETKCTYQKVEKVGNPSK